MGKQTVLSVEHVSKQFILPHEQSSDSLKRAITGLFQSRNTGYEVQHALKDVSFEVKKGEFFGILGRNGSGKSTMLKMLAGIYQPTEGTIAFEGKLVPFIELGVGFNPELTGRENVFLNGALLGFSKEEVEDRYDDIVRFAELEDFMDQKLKNYSSGMQVRLAFSVATHAEADILLIDEVLAVGDADFQRKCYNFFKSLKKSKKTVIFVTHDMGAVREYCDRAILIQEGVITHDASADKVADEYLKMFNQREEEPEESEDGEEEVTNRYGTGQVKFDSITATTTDDDVKITIELHNNKRESDIVVGLRIKDAEGRLVTGGNTLMYMKPEQGRLDLAPGERKTLRYTIDKSLFGAGTFSIGSSIKLRDKVTVCDDWEGAASFSVVAQESYYPIIAPAKLEVE
ncbi:ABC transporter ATP-binding protein [Candidatus Saccharibacteria bacterium]|nr:ABC transporter ATP-binding protein [Candidatus Saccharibacteria bacterium]